MTTKTASVLVDPNDPGYAEFPGVAFKNAAEWILLLVGAAFFALLAAFFARLTWQR